MNGEGQVERKALYDEMSLLRAAVQKVAVEGCAHEKTHTEGIRTLHDRIDNEKRIRETDLREERSERKRDIESARQARETMGKELDKKMESIRNQILVGIIVALTLAVVASKLL